jgi:hypothetical protein
MAQRCHWHRCARGPNIRLAVVSLKGNIYRKNIPVRRQIDILSITFTNKTVWEKAKDRFCSQRCHWHRCVQNCRLIVEHLCEWSREDVGSRSPLLKWGLPLKKGVFISYWLNAANSDPPIFEMSIDVLKSAKILVLGAVWRCNSQHGLFLKRFTLYVRNKCIIENTVNDDIPVL